MVTRGPGHCKREGSQERRWPPRVRVTLREGTSCCEAGHAGYGQGVALPTSIDLPATPWAFALQAYALPGVAPLCMRLQDEHGLDVDVVLACLWLAARGGTLDDPDLDRMLAAAAPARARVLELRALRHAVGSDREHDPRWQATYEQLKAAELAAERVELSCIETALAPTPLAPAAEPAGLALGSLRRYAARCGAPSCDPLLQTLVDHVLARGTPIRD
jgi:uncharacterized protein (TIGR02444 family)